MTSIHEVDTSTDRECRSRAWLHLHLASRRSPSVRRLLRPRRQEKRSANQRLGYSAMAHGVEAQWIRARPAARGRGNSGLVERECSGRLLRGTVRARAQDLLIPQIVLPLVQMGNSQTKSKGWKPLLPSPCTPRDNVSCRLQLKNTALKHLNVPNWQQRPTIPRASACWNEQLGSGLRSPRVLKSTVQRGN